MALPHHVSLSPCTLLLLRSPCHVLFHITVFIKKIIIIWTIVTTSALHPSINHYRHTLSISTTPLPSRITTKTTIPSTFHHIHPRHFPLFCLRYHPQHITSPPLKPHHHFLHIPCINTDRNITSHSFPCSPHIGTAASRPPMRVKPFTSPTNHMPSELEKGRGFLIGGEREGGAFLPS